MKTVVRDGRNAMKVWRAVMDLRGFIPTTKTQRKHLVRTLRELEREGAIHSVEDVLFKALVFLLRLDNELKAPATKKS